MELKWGELPFRGLSKKEAGIYFLYLAGFKYEEIQGHWKVSSKTISASIKRGIDKFGINRKVSRLYMKDDNDYQLCSECENREKCVKACEDLLKTLKDEETKKHDRTFTEYNLIEDLI